VAAEEIPYGLRRTPLAIVLFSAGGVGFFVWSSRIDEPTFMFPLGRVSEDTARVYLLLVGLACLAYVGMMFYIRYYKRPRVRIGEGEVTLVLGEFGGRTLTLHEGDVRALSETRTRGGWRVCTIEHESGDLEVHSAQLPDDAAYERVTEALRGLVRKRRKKPE